MPRKSLVLLTVCLATLTINISAMIVNIALPTLAVDLDATTRELLWVVDGYNLAFAALVLAMGSLSDKYGRRPALVLGLAGFAASNVAAALSTDSGVLIATRFAMGVFAALIFPTTLSIISNTFTDRRERATAIGLWGAAAGVGIALGPVVGGILLEHSNWHSVFWVMVPITAATLAMALVFVPESRDPHVPRIDRPGFVISVAALGLLTWTIIEAPEHGWGSSETIGGLVLAAALIIVFIKVERAVDNPMIDVTLFLDRRFSGASASVTIAFFALFGFVFLVTQFFQFVRDYTALETGLRFLPVAFSIAIASIISGQLAHRFGTRALVAPGMALMGGSFAWISTMPADVSYAAVIVPQMIMLGLGLGLVSTPATESILRVLPPSRAGVGSAVNDATRELGGTLGVAVAGSVFASQYAGKLLSLLGEKVDGATAAQAADSVGFAHALSAQVPGLRESVDVAFMDGFALACITSGALCLVGAVVAYVALPGKDYVSPADDPGDSGARQRRVLHA